MYAYESFIQKIKVKNFSRNMGLQCSRQGRLDDLYAYDLENKRLGPEGQCISVNIAPPDIRHCKSDKLKDLKDFVKVLEKQTFTSPKLKMKEKRENILIGEECTTFTENKFVNLPEGKVLTQKELKLSNPFTEMNVDDSYVELPEINELPANHDDTMMQIKKAKSKESLQSTDNSSVYSKDDKSYSEQSSISEDIWPYASYDVDDIIGKALVTKKDLQHLMKSVCTVIDQSSCGVICRKESKGHSLNLQLTLTSQNCYNRYTVKSPNKYTPSKRYKGMIFPPPNTEEAEKVSSYIEKRLSCGREKRSDSNSSGKEHRCDENIKVKNERYMKGACKCPKRSDHKSQVIPRRKNFCEGGDKKVSSTINSNIYDGLQCHLPNSNISFSPESFSGSNTPIEYNNSERGITSQRKITTTTATMTSIKNKESLQKNDDNSSQIRLRHLCSCHQRLREKLKPIVMSGTVDSESNLCKQIKCFHQERLESEESSGKSSRNSVSSVDVSFNSTRQGSLKSSNVKLKMTKADMKSPSPLSKCNSCDQTELSSSMRPAVWPGECVKPEEALTKITTTTTTTNNERLCFCKRMLGADYPCNHDNTVHHTHKHEHRHYHYFVPQITQ